MITVSGDLSLSMRMFNNKHSLCQSGCTIDWILSEVCGYFDISDEQLIKRSRKGIAVDARFFAIYFLKRILSEEITLEEIAELLNKKNHTTGIHARRQVIIRVSSMSDDLYKVYHLELCKRLGVDYLTDLKMLQYEGRFLKRRYIRVADRKIKEPVKMVSCRKPDAATQEKIIIRMTLKKEERPKAAYTNTNWEQQLEEKAKALAI